MLWVVASCKPLWRRFKFGVNARVCPRCSSSPPLSSSSPTSPIPSLPFPSHSLPFPFLPAPTLLPLAPLRPFPSPSLLSSSTLPFTSFFYPLIFLPYLFSPLITIPFPLHLTPFLFLLSPHSTTSFTSVPFLFFSPFLLYSTPFPPFLFNLSYPSYVPLYSTSFAL